MEDSHHSSSTSSSSTIWHISAHVLMHAPPLAPEYTYIHVNLVRLPFSLLLLFSCRPLRFFSACLLLQTPSVPESLSKIMWFTSVNFKNTDSIRVVRKCTPKGAKGTPERRPESIKREPRELLPKTVPQSLGNPQRQVFSNNKMFEGRNRRMY